MFLEIEGEKAVNIDLIDVIEFRHNEKSVKLYAGGVLIIPDSHIAYEYFNNKKSSDLFVAM